MKNLSIFFLLLAVCPTISAQNKEFISDGGMVQSNIDPLSKLSSWPKKGVWFSYWGSNKRATIGTVEDSDQGKVIQEYVFTASKQVDYDPWFGQRIVDVPTANIYRLSFKAKATNRCVTPKIAVTLRLKSTYVWKKRQAFKLVEFVYSPTSNEMGGTKILEIAEGWNTYYIDFDLTKVVSSLSEPSWEIKNNREYHILEATNDDRSDFYLTIQSYNVAGGDFAIDDVSLQLSPLSAVNPVNGGDQMKVQVVGRKIMINGLSQDDVICLTDEAGRMMSQQRAKGKLVAIDVKTSGVFIVSNQTRGKTLKIVVK